MKFIRNQDAYVPCIVEVDKLELGESTTLRIEDLMPHEVQRMDYIAQE